MKIRNFISDKTSLQAYTLRKANVLPFYEAASEMIPKAGTPFENVRKLSADFIPRPIEITIKGIHIPAFIDVKGAPDIGSFKVDVALPTICDDGSAEINTKIFLFGFHSQLTFFASEDRVFDISMSPSNIKHADNFLAHRILKKSIIDLIGVKPFMDVVFKDSKKTFWSSVPQKRARLLTEVYRQYLYYNMMI